LRHLRGWLCAADGSSRNSGSSRGLDCLHQADRYQEHDDTGGQACRMVSQLPAASRIGAVPGWPGFAL